MKAELLDHMGDDLAVVNAARVSFNKESLEFKDQDAKLIRYLADHDHWSPFAHTAIKFRVSAPVPIRTQCFKHKQGFVENEESRRYISSTPELYVPEYFRRAPTGGAKQGSVDEPHPENDCYLTAYKHVAKACIELYTEMVEEGIAPEQARFILPQGVEVNWIWTGNLYSYANFYRKRTDPHAQKEIRLLAEEIGKQIEPYFPVSWKALTNG